MVAYESWTARLRAQFLSQQKMEYGTCIFIQKVMKALFFSLPINSSFIDKIISYSIYVTAHKTSDEQKLNFLNWNQEIWVFFSRVMVNIVVIDWTNKHSNRSVNNNDSQRINFFLSPLQCTSLFTKTMCQVVAYPRLKTIKIFKTVSQNSGRGCLGEVVLYERFQYKALTENIFGVLGRWSLMGGGRTWRFDCILNRSQVTQEKAVFPNLNCHRL